MTGLASYSIGEKNNWRKWQWNRIVERLPCAKKDAKVLYLVGPDDLDRKIAIQKGFRPYNLFAVDIDHKKIISVRKQGGIGICEELQEIVGFWPNDNGCLIDVIVADFCCGFHGTAVWFIKSLLESQGVGSECVVSVNLLRGRDSKGNRTRHIAKLMWDLKNHKESVGKLCEMFGPQMDIANSKSRSAYFLYWYLYEFWAHLQKDGIKEEKYRIARLIESMKISLRSYKSVNGFQIMDSIVFKSIRPKALSPLWSIGFEDSKAQEAHLYYLKGCQIGVQRKIAALKAVRTKRMQELGVI